MKIISWNTNSRSNPKTLEKQCTYLKKGNYDVICLQEITIKSQEFFKDYFSEFKVVSSFDLVKNLSELIGKRKYGEIIISKNNFEKLNPDRIKIPYPERVLSVKFDSDLELLTTHIPPGSSNGVIKIEHFEGIYEYLKSEEKGPKILCGDFNSPKLETEDGEVVTWGQKINPLGKVRLSINPKWKNQCTAQRWDLGERNIIENHKSLGLKDAFRSINSYEDKSGSWFTNKGIARRYDHLFVSEHIEVLDSSYDQKPRIERLSDHSPLITNLKF